MRTDILRHQPDSLERAATAGLNPVELQDLLGSRRDMEDAEDLRRHFALFATDTVRLGGCEEALTVDREKAQKAFSNWTYRQITRWAVENGLTVEFAARGSLVLKRSGDPANDASVS
jgi:hypothetical protein